MTRSGVFLANFEVFGNLVERRLECLIDSLHKWRLNLNNNTLYILSLVLMFSDEGFFA